MFVGSLRSLLHRSQTVCQQDQQVYFSTIDMAEQTAREREIAQCKRTILEHREVDSKIKELRESTRDLQKQFAKTENDLKALQSVGQIIGEVLKKLDNEKYIVKAS